MEREELIELPLGHSWDMNTLRHTFTAIKGGIGLPSGQPGLVVVVGLCLAGSTVELHVLDEAESTDLEELLRFCRGFGQKYNLTGLTADTPFEWIGDSKSAAANRVIDRLNREGGTTKGRDRLVIYPTSILDMGDGAMSFCYTELHSLTMPEQKTLRLHGSRVAHPMQDARPEEIPDMRRTDAPAVFALAAVVTNLRDYAESVIRERNHPPTESKSRDLFGRDKFYRGRR